MDDSQLLRYSRQIMLPSIGIEGQQRLMDSQIVIIGVGGLGSPVAIYLAAAGVGRLVLCDDDRIDLSNLQRQIIHTTDCIDQAKTASAKERLQRLNPGCQVTTIAKRLAGEALAKQVKQADLVVDCSDNFTTRFALNRACVAAQTPLISGAAIRMEGQISVFSGRAGDPCYRCLYDEESSTDESCAENGVLAPVVGIVGCIQATEAIKWLTQAGDTLVGRLLLLDALSMEWRTLRLKADPKCPVCAQQ